MVNYYVADGTNQRGPFTAQELAGMGLKPDTLVWNEGMTQWQPAGQVVELRPFLSGQPGPQVAPAGQVAPGYVTPSYTTPYATFPPPGDIASKKLAAGLCGIILGFFGLGGLGVHKFILGLTSGAVTMLCITLGLGVLAFVTCGFSLFLVPVISLLGLVEGIVYLTKSDAEFYQIYMVQKRQWF